MEAPEFKDQKEMFEWIWENRDHVSEVSGEPLLGRGNMRWHWQFAHILNKGRFPSMKLREDNIILLLPEEHDKQDRYPEFQRRKERLLTEYYSKNTI